MGKAMTISRRQFFAAAAAVVLATPAKPIAAWTNYSASYTPGSTIGYAEFGHNAALRHRRYRMTVKKCQEVVRIFGQLADRSSA